MDPRPRLWLALDLRETGHPLLKQRFAQVDVDLDRLSEYTIAELARAYICLENYYKAAEVLSSVSRGNNIDAAVGNLSARSFTGLCMGLSWLLDMRLQGLERGDWQGPWKVFQHMYQLNSDTAMAASMRYEPFVVLARCHENEDLVHYWSQEWDALDHDAVESSVLGTACWRIYARLRLHGKNAEIETRLGLTASKALDRMLTGEPLLNDKLSIACLCAALTVDAGQASQIEAALNRLLNRCAELRSDRLDQLDAYALYVLSTKLADHGCFEHLVTLARAVFPLLKHVNDMKMRCELSLVVSLGCHVVVTENRDPAETRRFLDAAWDMVNELGACTTGIGYHPAWFNVALADVHFGLKSGLTNDDLMRKIDLYMNRLRHAVLRADKRRWDMCAFLGEVAYFAFRCFRDDLGHKYMTCLEEAFGKDLALAKVVATAKQRVAYVAAVRPSAPARFLSLETVDDCDALKGWDERYGFITLAGKLGEEASSFMAMAKDIMGSAEFFQWGPNADTEIRAIENVASDLLRLNVYVPESDGPGDSKVAPKAREGGASGTGTLGHDRHAGLEDGSGMMSVDWRVGETIKLIRSLLLHMERACKRDARETIHGWVRRVDEIASNGALTDFQKTVKLLIGVGADIITGLAERNAAEATVFAGLCLAWRGRMLGSESWLRILHHMVKSTMAQRMTTDGVDGFKREVATALYLIGLLASSPEVEKATTQEMRRTQNEMLTTARLIETQLWLEVDCEEPEAEGTVRDGYVKAVGKVYRRMANHPVEVQSFRCILEACHEIAGYSWFSSSFFPRITRTKANTGSDAMLYGVLGLRAHAESVIEFLDGLPEFIRCPYETADAKLVASYWRSQMAVVRFFTDLLNQAVYFGAIAPGGSDARSLAHRMRASLVRLRSIIAEHLSRV